MGPTANARPGCDGDYTVPFIGIDPAGSYLLDLSGSKPNARQMV
jgi:hypothetical protein